MIIRLLRSIVQPTLYIRVLPNRFLVHHIESGRSSVVDADESFTTRRLLVGEYGPAVDALRRAIKEIGMPYFSTPRAVIHPLEMVEGGLSGVEHRMLMEVVEGAGARGATVWVGRELQDAEVREKLESA